MLRTRDCRREKADKKNWTTTTGWKATEEYPTHRGTKIRVFRACFRAPFLPPFFPHFSYLFPLQALITRPPLLPSSPPPLSLLSILTPGKLRFLYPSDLCTFLCPADKQGVDYPKQFFEAKKWFEVNFPLQGIVIVLPRTIPTPFSQTLRFMGKQTMSRKGKATLKGKSPLIQPQSGG